MMLVLCFALVALAHCDVIEDGYVVENSDQPFFALYGDGILDFEDRKIPKAQALEECASMNMELATCSRAEYNKIVEDQPDWVNSWHSVWCSPVLWVTDPTEDNPQRNFISEEGYVIRQNDPRWAAEGHGRNWKDPEDIRPEPDNTGDCTAYRLSEDGGQGLLDLECEGEERQAVCVRKRSLWFSQEKVTRAAAIGQCESMGWEVPLCTAAELDLILAVNTAWATKWSVIWCQYQKDPLSGEYIGFNGEVYGNNTWALETNDDGRRQEGVVYPPEPNGSGDCTAYRMGEVASAQGMIDLACDEGVARWAVCIHPQTVMALNNAAV
jgi:hypothetical protein